MELGNFYDFSLQYLLDRISCEAILQFHVNVWRHGVTLARPHFMPTINWSEFPDLKLTILESTKIMI